MQTNLIQSANSHHKILYLFFLNLGIANYISPYFSLCTGNVIFFSEARQHTVRKANIETKWDVSRIETMRGFIPTVGCVYKGNDLDGLYFSKVCATELLFSYQLLLALAWVLYKEYLPP